MRVLEEFTFEEKKYICMQKVSIDSMIIIIGKELDTEERVYLSEGANGTLERIADDSIKKRAQDLIYAKSEDMID